MQFRSSERWRLLITGGGRTFRRLPRDWQPNIPLKSREQPEWKPFTLPLRCQRTALRSHAETDVGESAQRVRAKDCYVWINAVKL
jgi:hypothetical protein